MHGVRPGGGGKGERERERERERCHEINSMYVNS